jgi:hypothetical protein
MRRLLTGTWAIVIVLAIAVGYSPPTTDATVDASWTLTREDERQLYEFEVRAEAAGALGFYRDEATATLVVLVPASRGADFQVGSLGPVPVPVIIKVSNLDPGAIQIALEKLQEIGRRHPGLSMVYFFDAEREAIRVDASLEPGVLSTFLGDSWPLIEYHSGGFVPLSRFDDSSPFRGGAAIDIENWDDPYYDCTVGFTVVNGSGQKALVTAAHCGPINYTVLTPDNNRVVGTTGPKWCQDTGDDLMLIKGKNYGPYIYIGGQNGSTGSVYDAADPVVGSLYNYSGAATYEKASQTVLSLSGSGFSKICDQEGYLVNLIVFTRKYQLERDCQAINGDSGAPFYFKNSNFSPPRIHIRGMVIGRNDEEDLCYAMRYSRIQQRTGYSIY